MYSSFLLRNRRLIPILRILILDHSFEKGCQKNLKLDPRALDHIIRIESAEDDLIIIDGHRSQRTSPRKGKRMTIIGEGYRAYDRRLGQRRSDVAIRPNNWKEI